MSERKSYSKEFKLQVLEEAKAGVSINELERRYEIGKGMIYRWRRNLRSRSKNPFPGQGSRNTDKAKTAEMERLIGRQAMEIDFLKKAARRLKETGE